MKNDDEFDKVFGPQSTESVSPVQNTGNNSSSERELHHSGAGKASFWLGLGYPGAWLLSLVMPGDIIFVLILLAVIANILGLVLGIVALFQKGYKKGYAIAGAVINVLFLLSLIILVIVILNAF